MGVYRRDDTWWIDYYVGGKRKREAVGPKKKEAEAALGKALGLIREGRYFDVKKIKPITFDDMADKFFEWLKANRKSDDYLYTLPPAEECFKGQLLTGVTEHEIETYRAMLRDVPTTAGKPRTNSTVNHELAILKQLFAKAIAWGYLEKGKDPTENVKKLPESKGRIRFLSLEEAKALLAAASPHLRPIIVTALETGMRRGEILRLTWGDIDKKNGILYVKEAKNGDPRHVPMSSRLQETLKALPRRLGTDYVFTGGIRHTAASYLVMAGVPMKTVGEILGHKSATMTERYSHLTPEHKRQAVELLPDWEENDGHKSVTTGA